MVADLREVIARLVADNRQLVTRNRELTERVEELEAELGRTSQNSGKPPSSDSVTERAAQNAKRRSQRRPSPRKPGKQPGADGKHPARVADPDHVITHTPSAFRGCGAGLAGAVVVGEQSRQVFDLPQVRLEHRRPATPPQAHAATTGTITDPGHPQRPARHHRPSGSPSQPDPASQMA